MSIVLKKISVSEEKMEHLKRLMFHFYQKGKENGDVQPRRHTEFSSLFFEMERDGLGSTALWPNGSGGPSQPKADVGYFERFHFR
jgi:hypothetical protein